MTSPNPSPAKASSGNVIWIAAVGVVVLLGVVALIAARGSKDDTDAATAKAAAPKTVSTEAKGASTTLPPFDASKDDAAVGQVIPTVSGTTLDDKPITISSDGKAKIIMFVAHWCPHCQREVPLIATHLEKAPMPDDVDLIMVSTAVDKNRGNWPPATWLKAAGWTLPVMADSADSTAGKTFGLTAFPYFVVVDADGKVVFRTSGEITVDQFDQLIKAAQTGEAPTT